MSYAMQQYRAKRNTALANHGIRLAIALALFALAFNGYLQDQSGMSMILTIMTALMVAVLALPVLGPPGFALWRARAGAMAERRVIRQLNDAFPGRVVANYVPRGWAEDIDAIVVTDNGLAVVEVKAVPTRPEATQGLDRAINSAGRRALRLKLALIDSPNIPSGVRSAQLVVAVVGRKWENHRNERIVGVRHLKAAIEASKGPHMSESEQAAYLEAFRQGAV